MLKFLKLHIKQKKKKRSYNVQSRKKKIINNYEEHFPIPQMNKSTDHLIEKDQTAVISQSAKITKQILKFWLI